MGAGLSAWSVRWAERVARLPPGTNAFRWVDDKDFTVDVFGEVAVLSLYAPRARQQELDLGKALFDSASLRAIYLKRRPREAHGKVEAEQLAPTEPLCGTSVRLIEAAEGGAKFEIRPANGLSVGLYLDARDARAWVRANAAGRTVLNLFAYTCGFGVAARLGGATRAVNVDLSRKVLDWGELNHAHNALSVDRRDFIAGDCFDWLGRFAKKTEQFGLVVLDPPSFSNADGRRFRVETDYGDLVSAASRVVAPDGILVCCCNLEGMGPSQFERVVSAGLGGRSASQLAAFGASSIDFAQPPALKVLALALSGAPERSARA